MPSFRKINADTRHRPKGEDFSRCISTERACDLSHHVSEVSLDACLSPFLIAKAMAVSVDSAEDIIDFVFRGIPHDRKRERIVQQGAYLLLAELLLSSACDESSFSGTALSSWEKL